MPPPDLEIACVDPSVDISQLVPFSSLETFYSTQSSTNISPTSCPLPDQKTTLQSHLIKKNKQSEKENLDVPLKKRKLQEETRSQETMESKISKPPVSQRS